MRRQRSKYSRYDEFTFACRTGGRQLAVIPRGMYTSSSSIKLRQLGPGEHSGIYVKINCFLPAEHSPVFTPIHDGLLEAYVCKEATFVERLDIREYCRTTRGQKSAGRIAKISHRQYDSMSALKRHSVRPYRFGPMGDVCAAVRTFARIQHIPRAQEIVQRCLLSGISGRKKTNGSKPIFGKFAQVVVANQRSSSPIKSMQLVVPNPFLVSRMRSWYDCYCQRVVRFVQPCVG